MDSQWYHAQTHDIFVKARYVSWPKGTYHTGYRLPCRFKRRMRCFHPGADLDDLIQFCGPGLDGKVLQPNHDWKPKTLGLTSSMRLLVNVRLFENWIKSKPIRKRDRWWLIPHNRLYILMIIIDTIWFLIIIDKPTCCLHLPLGLKKPYGTSATTPRKPWRTHSPSSSSQPRRRSLKRSADWPHGRESLVGICHKYGVYFYNIYIYIYLFISGYPYIYTYKFRYG